MATEQGNKKAILATLLSAALLTGSGWSIAADKPESGKPGMGMHSVQGMGGKEGMGMHGGQGMGGKEGMGGMQGMGGMMGMMDMMGSHSRKMRGDSVTHGIPQLPPGNVKLQLQMHAEMMQKMGEILAKYAAQIKEEKN